MNNKFSDDNVSRLSSPVCHACVDCVYRQKDLTIKGKTLSRHNTGICEKYTELKPKEVLFGNGKCPNYKKQ